MSMIENQVEKLKFTARNIGEYCGSTEYLREILLQAADTIEALSAKLSSANMERSERIENKTGDGRMGNERLKEGDIVQHFKRELIEDKEHSMEYLYIIETIATYTETGEKLVVYRALYKNDKGVHFNVFARPYDMFMSDVDHEKYPNIKQKHRFEKFDVEN